MRIGSGMRQLSQMLKWLVFIFLPKLPRKLSDHPGEHSDFDIGWSLQDGWRRLAAQRVNQMGPQAPASQARMLAGVKISAVFIKRTGEREAFAFVRPNPGLRQLPDVALGLLLGVPEHLARTVNQTIRELDEDLLSPRHLVIGCEFADGLWQPFNVERNFWGIESEAREEIEEAVRQRLMVIQRRLRFSNSDTEEEIAQSLPSRWVEIVEDHYQLLGEYLSHDHADLLRSARIEVVEAHMLSAGRALAVVRTNVGVEELPDLALALLLGTREDLARAVFRNRCQLMDIVQGPRRDIVPVYCLLEDGEWDIAGNSEEDSAAEPETRAAIGEAVQIQTDWKEPPFAVTVLGPPESAGNALVRLPVRVSSILPLWRLGDVAFPAMVLESDESQDDGAAWDNIGMNPRHSFPPGLVLVKGGSEEGYVYFGPEDGSPHDGTFTELHYLDDTEQIVMVELDRRVQPPERVQFEGGTLVSVWGNLPTYSVSERLKGSQWENLPIPAMAGVGETVEVFEPNGRDYEPWYSLTVLRAPETFDEETLRVRLRITSHREELRVIALDFQLSAAPDRFGRLQFLLEPPWNAESSELADSFEDTTLGMGGTHEAFVYFRNADNEPVPRPETLSLLWYGARTFEFPVLLAIE